ncbi:nuclear transport factor 2 family protein [Flavobacterium sp. FlaQc-57]|uniref:nuclear transport factor 2 family protein n=1 Tax=Flavobacterium sp. FlaQc-57 TaxID=3374186 RepID=UPI003757C48D
MTAAQKFAREWIESWNSHDLELIMSHYTEDIEISTPMLKLTTGIENDSLKGKQAVANYWEKALAKFPDLHFELVDVTQGVSSVALYYKSVMGKRAVEVMFFNDEHLVNKMITLYTDL